MDRRDKLGCVIILGMALWIGLTYFLLTYFGERPVLRWVVIAGWVVLVILVIKDFKLEGEGDKDRPF